MNDNFDTKTLNIKYWIFSCFCQFLQVLTGLCLVRIIGRFAAATTSVIYILQRYVSTGILDGLLQSHQTNVMVVDRKRLRCSLSKFLPIYHLRRACHFVHPYHTVADILSRMGDLYRHRIFI
jgi:hypothetical protein